MSTSPLPPTPEPAPASSDQERLEQALRELAALRSGVNHATLVTGLTGGLLLAGVCILFYFACTLADDFTRPQNLVDLAQQLVDENIYDARAALEREILTATPSWMRALSQQIRKSLPELEQDAESFISSLFDAGAPARLIGEQEYRGFLHKHRAQWERRFKELQIHPKGSPEFGDELAAALEQEFGGKMRAEAAALLGRLKRANAAWRALAAGQDLTEEAALQRRVWMLARRRHLQEADPALLKKLDAGK